MPSNLVVWFMEAISVRPQQLSAAKRRNIQRTSINHHMTSTKSLADLEKAAILWISITVW